MGTRRRVISLSSRLYQRGIFNRMRPFSIFLIINFITVCFILISIKSTSSLTLTNNQALVNNTTDEYYSPTILIEETIKNEENSISILNNLLYDEVIYMNARVNQDINRIILYKRPPATISVIYIFVNHKLISEVNDVYDDKSEIYTIYFYNVIPANSSLQVQFHFEKLPLLTLKDIFEFDVITLTNNGFDDSKNLQMGISLTTHLLAIFLSKLKFTILSGTDSESWEYTCNLSNINASSLLRTAYEAHKILNKFFHEKYQLPTILLSYQLSSIVNTTNFTEINAINTRSLYELKKVVDKEKEQHFISTLVREWSYMYLNLMKSNLEAWKQMSEGLAIYFQYYGNFRFLPTFLMHRRFIEEHLLPALTADASQSSNSIMSIMSSNQISLNISPDNKAMIDSKISSLFRMLHLTFGLPIFRNALYNFYQQGKHSNVTMDDLWNFLQEEIFFVEDIDPDLNIKKIMASWINQAGYPLLTVNVSGCNVILHQSRFLGCDVNNIVNQSDNSLWWIPITWITKKTLNLKSTVPIYWFNQRTDKIMIPNEVNNDWIIFNTARTGFYRVNYDKDSWKRILDTLNSQSFTSIPLEDRIAIIDDIINLAKTGQVSVQIYQRGLEYIRKETYAGPTKIALKELINLHEYYSDSDDSDDIDEFIFYILKWIYDEMGYSKKLTDDKSFISFRTDLNFLMDDIKFKKCIRSTQDYWNKVFNNTISKETIETKTYNYCSSFNMKLKKYDRINLDKLSSSSAVERPLAGLPRFCTQNFSDLPKWLNIFQAANKYSDDLKLQVLRKNLVIMKNIGKCGNKGVQLVLKYLTQDLEPIKYHCKSDQLLFLDLVSSLSQKFIKPTDTLDQLIKLIKIPLLKCSQVEKYLNVVLENKQLENNFYKRNHDIIIKWSKQNNNDLKKYQFYRYLLQNNILPMNYIIKLTPHMIPENFYFDGEVIIIAKVVQEASNIYIHFHNLIYKSINLKVDGRDIAITYIKHNKPDQFLEIQISEKLRVQSIINITIQYKGNIGEEKRGLYRDFYINHLNQVKWFAATNLESASARRLFPCFDEPFIKAVFQLQINRTADFITVSNTRFVSTIEDNGRYIDIFEETQEISTHQVAFVLSEFNSSDQLSKTLTWFDNNKSFDLIYPIIQTENFFENIEKLVNPSNPNDYTYDDQLAQLKNQLENYGLIVYNEKNVITHPNYVSLFDKLTYITNWAHEMMYRFFRNYLFVGSWKCEWFTRAISYHFLSVGYENDMEAQAEGSAIFIVHHLQPSMLIDASPLGATFIQEDYIPEQINNVYNQFPDDKGISILRMIEATSDFTNTIEFFKNFVINTINVKKLSSFYATKWGECSGINQFCKIITDNISLNTKNSAIYSNDIIKHWLNQKGFPIVHVSIENTIIIISQTPFRSNLSPSVNSEHLWNIPITWTSSANPNFFSLERVFFLTKPRHSFPINELGDNDWIIFNLQQIGYYRVNYDVTLWNRIINTLTNANFLEIHQNNRAAVIDDLFNLARGGYVNYTMALSAAKYLTQEKCYAPWKAALVNFKFLDKRLVAKPHIHEKFKIYVKKLIETAYKKLGFNEKDDEGYSKSLLRINILEWACKYKYISCITKCLTFFNNWIYNPTNLIPVNIRGIVYCTAISNGNTDNWRLLFSEYVKTNYQSEKYRIIKALTCTENPQFLQKLLLYSISRNSKLKIQESLDIFSVVYSSGCYGVKATLSFMSKNYDDILDYFKDFNIIKSILEGLAAHITTPELVREFENFVQNIDEGFMPIKETILLIIAQIQEEVSWHNAYFTIISEFLGKFNNPETPDVNNINNVLDEFL